jgi:hypothetical protein
MFGPVNSVKWRTAALVCLACVVEGADLAVLPAVYLFIAQSLKASPSQLGLMTLCRALMQALASPIRHDFASPENRFPAYFTATAT